MNFIGIFQH